MAEKYGFRVLKFWTVYRPNADGSLREIDMVAYAPIGMAQSRVTEDAVSRLSKLQPLEENSENEAAKMAHARWNFIKPAYDAWKTGQDVPTHGTPLSAWSGLTSEKAEIIKAAGVRTVEELAEANEMTITQIRLPGMIQLREQAKLFLASFDKSATAMRLQATEDENKALKSDLEEMKAMLLEMQGQMAEKKRGRPPVAREEVAA